MVARFLMRVVGYIHLRGRVEMGTDSEGTREVYPQWILKLLKELAGLQNV
jgi:hypothetical protein